MFTSGLCRAGDWKMPAIIAASRQARGRAPTCRSRSCDAASTPSAALRRGAEEHLVGIQREDLPLGVALFEMERVVRLAQLPLPGLFESEHLVPADRRCSSRVAWVSVLAPAARRSPSQDVLLTSVIRMTPGMLRPICSGRTHRPRRQRSRAGAPPVCRRNRRRRGAERCEFTDQFSRCGRGPA